MNWTVVLGQRLYFASFFINSSLFSFSSGIGTLVNSYCYISRSQRYAPLFSCQLTGLALEFPTTCVLPSPSSSNWKSAFTAPSWWPYERNFFWLSNGVRYKVFFQVKLNSTKQSCCFQTLQLYQIHLLKTAKEKKPNVSRTVFFLAFSLCENDTTHEQESLCFSPPVLVWFTQGNEAQESWIHVNTFLWVIELEIIFASMYSVEQHPSIEWDTQ